MISQQIRTRFWVVKVAGFMAVAIAFASWKFAPIGSASDEVALSAELQRARQASISANEGLRSATGSGVFTVQFQQVDEIEPTLTTKAKVAVQFDRGKYHIHVAFETKLVRVVTEEDGQKTVKLVNDGAEDVDILSDGETVYVVRFSNRIRPTGCAGDIFSSNQQKRREPSIMSGFPWSEPARFWKEVADIDAIIKRNGADSLSLSELESGRYRVLFPASKPIMEFDIERDAGFQITSLRAYNPKQKRPVQNKEATWSVAKETWHVTQFVDEWDNREVDPERGHYSRAVFLYESFEVNAEIDPRSFQLSSLSIPVRTRFIDRRERKDRPNATEEIMQYWNGTELQPRRP
jgi:hypothetical protein